MAIGLIGFCLCLTTLLVGEIPSATLQMMPLMNEIYHPVSTTSQEAQGHFNQGLTYIFAFNHDRAYQEFENAAKLDPELAMAYWGMALALGQNINSDVTPENELKAYSLVQKAQSLATGASLNEQSYISALAKRYTNDSRADLIPLRYSYRTAMKQVMESYPEDLDAATLYAESILDLKPWEWWTTDGKPQEGTWEAVDTLEYVLQRNPLHIGANHYYIHAMEESPWPERALMSAHRLETLFPASGHLLHMPSHIFIAVGHYESAIKTNLKAIQVDRDYIKAHGLSGTYPVHYLSHNLYVLTHTYVLTGDYENALKAAVELNQVIQSEIDHYPRYALAPLEVYLYFHKWMEILDYHATTENSIVQAYQHFSRAMAYAHLNDMSSAQKEKQQMLALTQQISSSIGLGNNYAKQVFDIADLVLKATLNSNPAQSIEFFRQAVALQDKLSYDEPPDWYIPIRQQLGAALLQEKRWKEAEEVFRIALKDLRRNGYLLFGLWLALINQQRTIDAYWVEREMHAALQLAPKRLSLDHL